MSLWHFGRGSEAAARSVALAEALRHGPASAFDGSRPFAAEFGVVGAGLATDGNGLVPAVFVTTMEPLGAMRTDAIDRYPGAVEAIKRALPDTSWLDEIVAVPVAPVRLQAHPGDPISVAKWGQLGAPVRWSGGSGYLTAGHVAGTRGASVQDANGTTIGTAVEVINPAPGTPGSDVAIVELAAGQYRGNRLGISGTGRAVAADSVDVHTQSGPATATIFGYAAFFLVGSSVVVSDVYQTGTGVTQAADSGGPVLLTNTTDVIGHVVAGGANLTCIQDIRTQLGDLRAIAGYATIQV